MKHTIYCLAIVAMCISTARYAHAEVITFDATVKSVDTKSRTLTVERKGKTRDLDVSRRAKISIDGDKAEFESLQPGQQVELSYHNDLEIVLKVNASVNGISKPELIALDELNTPGIDAYPFLSPDGLTIYWNACRPGETTLYKDAWVWTAKRKDMDSYFEDKQLLLKGRHPTVSADGLEIIVLRPRENGSKGESLHIAKRNSVDDKFSRTKGIQEFSNVSLRSPSLSHDGLKLVVALTDKNGIDHLAVSERPTINGEWRKPNLIQMEEPNSGFMSLGSYVGDSDLLSIHGVLKPSSPGIYRFMYWTKTDKSKGYEQYKYIEPAGISNFGGMSPRYVAATNELFYSAPQSSDNLKPDLWVVKQLELK